MIADDEDTPPMGINTGDAMDPQPTDHEVHLTGRLTAIFKGGEKLAKYFFFAHLPEHLRGTSVKFAELAADLCETITGSAERTVALRKLVESKDAAVRCNVPDPA